MLKNKLKRGDVVTVEEMTDDEQIKGYIIVPGHQDSIRVTTTIASFDHVEYVGSAAFENEQEWIKH